MFTLSQSRPVAKRKAPVFTAESARTFENGERVTSMIRFSAAVADRVGRGEHPTDCRCQAYESAFTCARWKAQGYRPRKGTKAFKMPIIIERDAEITNADGKTKTDRVKLFRAAYVFCQCQVCPLGASNGDGAWSWTVGAGTLEAERGSKGGAA